jgi:hypothetical protein
MTEKNECALLLYFKLIAILSFPAVFVILYSFADKELGKGDMILQKTDIADYFRNNASSTALVDTTVISEQDSIVVAADSIVLDTLPQRILLFGDSMLEGIGKRMERYAAENNHELLYVIWYASSTKIWAEHIDTLKHFMQKFQPTYIVISLGTNELLVKEPNKRNSYINTIIQVIGDIPYVWIGPPNWKKDTGINQVIEDNVGTHRFFPSKKLTYKRGSDSIHPTLASAARWTDSIAYWMSNEVKHRITLELPKKTNRSGKYILLQPIK